MKSAFLAAIALAGAAQAASAASVRISIANVRNARGVVHVELCPQTAFLKDGCPYSAEVPAHPGTVTLVLSGVAPGEYAAQATHDENRNGRVDRNFLGIPKEGVGFSRDARIRMAPPRWIEAAFAVTAVPEQQIAFAMRYFL